MHRAHIANGARCTTNSALQASRAAAKSPQTCQASPRDSSAVIDRRQLLSLGLTATTVAGTLLGSQPVAASQSAGDWSSPGLAAPEDDGLPKFFKTSSGVKVQVLSPGAGPAAQKGDAVLIDYVLRRANGYFIYGTVEGVSFQPKDVPIGPIKLQLGSGEVIEGLEDVLVGMQQGGKRRILVPPEAGYVSSILLPQPPTYATKRQLANHSNEPLLFEVQLLRVLPGTVG